MRFFKLLVVYFLLFNVAFSQNLVTNPSFEIVSSDVLQCGFYQSNIDFNKSVTGWTNPGDGTSDIFSLLVKPYCVTYAYPNMNSTNNVGEQLPRTGNVMAGIITSELFSPNNNNFTFREYIQNKLQTPLTIGQKYHLVFYVSLGDWCANAANSIGVYFSVESKLPNPVQGISYVIPVTPQIEFKSFITDDSSWVKLEGDIIADAAYNYLTIGNFRDNKSFSVIRHEYDEFHTYYNGSYYFIDDVTLYPVCGKRKMEVQNACYGNSLNLMAPTEQIIGWADSIRPENIFSKKINLEVKPPVTTTYFLYRGMCDTISYTANVLGNLSVDLGKDVGIYPGQKIVLDAGNKGAGYQWSDGSDKQTFEVAQGGEYWVTVSDSYNCSKIDSIHIIDIDLEMPNVFTPNGDDKNEHFIPIKMSGVVSSEMLIYNRWGKQVFKTNDLTSGWDGGNLEPAVYYWALNYTDFNGKESSMKGNVTLLR